MTEPATRSKIISSMAIWAVQAILAGLVGWVAIEIRQDANNVSANVATMQRDISSLTTSVAEVRREIEITKPSEVLAAVREVDARVLAKDDIRDLLLLSSPWLRDKEGIQKQLYDLERRIDRIEQKTDL